MVSGERAFISSSHQMASVYSNSLAKESPRREEGDGDKLDEVARREREYVHGRLREELKREPTEEEVSEWLREHTEGY